MQRVIAILQLLSLAIGIVIGAATIWPWIVVPRELQVDILDTPARPPGSLLQDMKEFPERFVRRFQKDELLVKLLPDVQSRVQLTDQIQRELAESMDWLLRFEFRSKALTVATVRNTGDKLLRSVRLTFRYANPGTATIVAYTGEERIVESGGAIEVGDMPPQTSAQVYIWGLGITGSAFMTASHDGGVGANRIAAFVSPPVMQHGGFYVSYRHTTYGLFAIVLIALGIGGISRLWLSRAVRSS